MRCNMSGPIGGNFLSKIAGHTMDFLREVNKDVSNAVSFAIGRVMSEPSAKSEKANDASKTSNKNLGHYAKPALRAFGTPVPLRVLGFFANAYDAVKGEAGSREVKRKAGDNVSDPSWISSKDYQKTAQEIADTVTKPSIDEYMPLDAGKLQDLLEAREKNTAEAIKLLKQKGKCHERVVDNFAANTLAIELAGTKALPGKPAREGKLTDQEFRGLMKDLVQKEYDKGNAGNFLRGNDITTKLFTAYVDAKMGNAMKDGLNAAFKNLAQNIRGFNAEKQKTTPGYTFKGANLEAKAAKKLLDKDEQKLFNDQIVELAGMFASTSNSFPPEIKTLCAAIAEVSRENKQDGTNEIMKILYLRFLQPQFQTGTGKEHNPITNKDEDVWPEIGRDIPNLLLSFINGSTDALISKQGQLNFIFDAENKTRDKALEAMKGGFAFAENG